MRRKGAHARGAAPRRSRQRWSPAERALLLVVALLLAATACTGASAPDEPAITTVADGTGPAATPGTVAAERPLVAVSTPLVGALVRSVAGDQVDVQLLGGVGVDPDRAALIVRIDEEPTAAGSGDGSPADVLLLAPQLNPVPLGGSELDPSAAEGTTVTDPHVWLDPDRWTQAARLVTDRLGELPGIDAAALAANVAAFDEAASRADETLQASFASVPDDQRVLVSDLPALTYLADRYGFELVLAEGAEALAAAASAAGVGIVLVSPERQATLGAELAGADPGVAVVGIDLEGTELVDALDGSAEQATLAYSDLLITASATIVGALDT